MTRVIYDENKYLLKYQLTSFIFPIPQRGPNRKHIQGILGKLCFYFTKYVRGIKSGKNNNQRFVQTRHLAFFSHFFVQIYYKKQS